MSEKILEITDLLIEADINGEWTPIVHSLSMTLERGEIIGLIGESGAGKSTFGLTALGYTKPGCRIVIINHFRSANRMIGLIETLICPLCMHLGWRSDLSLQELIRTTGLHIDYRYKLEPVDLWETVFARIPDSVDHTVLRRSA